MKVVYKAEALIWSVLDNAEIKAELIEDSSKAREALEDEADAVRDMVRDIIDDPDFNPGMTNEALDAHAYIEEGDDGEVWELDGKRSESLADFLPMLEARLLKELDAGTRKQVSLRISEKALGDASDALAGIAPQLSEVQCLRVIVEALGFSDWEALVKRHEPQIRRAVANAQTASKWKK